MPNCDVVATEKPIVWKDEQGWNCDQSTFCRKCQAVNLERIAEDASWEDAVAASAQGRPVVSA